MEAILYEKYPIAIPKVLRMISSMSNTPILSNIWVSSITNSAATEKPDRKIKFFIFLNSTGSRKPAGIKITIFETMFMRNGLKSASVHFLENLMMVSNG